MTPAAIGFWSALAVLGFTYAGYPLLLALVASLYRRKVRRAPVDATVTVVVVAHDEQDCIRQKVDNLLSLDFPSSRLEVLVARSEASWCSSTRTPTVPRSPTA